MLEAIKGDIDGLRRAIGALVHGHAERIAATIPLEHIVHDLERDVARHRVVVHVVVVAVVVGGDEETAAALMRPKRVVRHHADHVLHGRHADAVKSVRLEQTPRDVHIGIAPYGLLLLLLLMLLGLPILDIPVVALVRLAHTGRARVDEQANEPVGAHHARVDGDVGGVAVGAEPDATESVVLDTRVVERCVLEEIGHLLPGGVGDDEAVEAVGAQRRLVELLEAAGVREIGAVHGVGVETGARDADVAGARVHVQAVHVVAGEARLVELHERVERARVEAVVRVVDELGAEDDQVGVLAVAHHGEHGDVVVARVGAEDARLLHEAFAFAHLVRIGELVERGATRELVEAPLLVVEAQLTERERILAEPARSGQWQRVSVARWWTVLEQLLLVGELTFARLLPRVLGVELLELDRLQEDARPRSCSESAA